MFLGQHFGNIDHSLGQPGRVVRDVIVLAQIISVVKNLRDFLIVHNSISQLPLNGYGLIITGNFFEHERNINRGYRYNNDRSCGSVIVE
ncbi:hypothetical protein D3C81_1281930 [compost metagenome]